MKPRRNTLLEFGIFQADADARLLIRDGRIVPLPPKAFDVLLRLIESDGRAVMREELLAGVWGEVHVEEANLTQAISVLRKALGEDAQGPEYVVTVPRRGYRFGVPVREAAPVLRTAPAQEPIRSLVVLPFLSLDVDPNHEYFSDGLTEEITNALTLIPDLRIVARTTAFQFKGRSLDIREIGEKLSVDAVLEGSVRRQGKRLRITAQLSSTKDGYHYWSRTWERDLKDIFVVQQEIAGKIIETLQREHGSARSLFQTTTNDPEAYDLFLKALSLGNRLLLPEAITELELAIKRDPGFASAHAALAYLYALLGYEFRLHPKDACPTAKKHARRALELNPSLSSAHFALGWISTFYDWNWEAAEQALRRAIHGNQAMALAHHAYAHFLVAMGRFPEALEESRRMLSEDPSSPTLTGHLAWHYIYASEPDKAIEPARRSLVLEPNLSTNLRYLRWAYEATGEFEDAIRTAACHHAPELISRLRGEWQGAGEAGYWQTWLDFLLEERRKNGTGPSNTFYQIATIYAKLGQKKEALQWLQRGLNERDNWMVYMKVDPNFQAIRQVPGFEEIARKVGLP